MWVWCLLIRLDHFPRIRLEEDFTTCRSACINVHHRFDPIATNSLVTIPPPFFFCLPLSIDLRVLQVMHGDKGVRGILEGFFSAIEY